MATNLYDDSNLGELDPDDLNRFQTRRRQARQAHSIGSAQNQYKEDQANRRYSRGRSDLRRQYQRSRRSFGGEFANRGLLNSGLYDQAYKDLRVDRAQGYADLRRQHQDTLRGLELAGRQLNRVRDDALDDVESAEAARRQSVAAALDYAKREG